MSLLNKIATKIWLSDSQISRLSDPFLSNPYQTTYPWVAWQRRFLAEAIESAKNIDSLSLKELIKEARGSDRSLNNLAVELVEALSVLEDQMRRMDPIGECVRWVAKGRTRNFLSFPERVSLITTPPQVN